MAAVYSNQKEITIISLFIECRKRIIIKKLIPYSWIKMAAIVWYNKTQISETWVDI